MSRRRYGAGGLAASLILAAALSSGARADEHDAERRDNLSSPSQCSHETASVHEVLSRDRLLDLARNRESGSGPFDRTIDVHMGRLRRKLGDAATDPRFIGTVRTIGYKFIPAVEKRDPSGTAA